MQNAPRREHSTSGAGEAFRKLHLLLLLPFYRVPSELGWTDGGAFTDDMLHRSAGSTLKHSPNAVPAFIDDPPNDDLRQIPQGHAVVK